MLHPLTRWSAAMAVKLWAEHEAHFPCARECTPANGLPHFTTLYHIFSSMADLQCTVAALSAGDVVAWSQTGQVPQKVRRCLRCDVTIPAEGDVWRCAACRRLAARLDDTPTFRHRALQHFLLSDL